MTAFGTTYQTYQGIGLREDLADMIYDISPRKTPFMSQAGRETAKQTLIEWQTDSLAAAVSTNKQIEGDDITAIDAATPTVRVGNYTQISRKLALVADTMDAVDKAGRNSELAYQISKLAAELKRDMETTCLSVQAGAAGGASTARATAGLGAWVKTNDTLSTGGGSPAYTSGVPGAARTDGTQVAFTETILKATIILAYNSGAEPDTLMVGPVNTQRVSGFTGIATRNFDLSNATPKPTAIIGAANVYVSDFGNFKVIPNRFQRERDAWLLDFDYVSLAYLRQFQTVKLAKTGDAEKRMLLAEWGLKVKQEAALGLAADLTTT